LIWQGICPFWVNGSQITILQTTQISPLEDALAR
jgi:hypothetical protein